LPPTTTLKAMVRVTSVEELRGNSRTARFEGHIHGAPRMEQTDLPDG
jgi:hypothetical protein